MEQQEPMDSTAVREKMTSAELAKCWIAYMGNSMSRHMLDGFLQQVEDQDIKTLILRAQSMANQYVQTMKAVFINEKVAIPAAYSEDDVMPGASRLFLDAFYLHYMKYVCKIAIGIYGIAVPLMTRVDIRDFFTGCLQDTVQLVNSINEVLIAKGELVKPPYIPVPSQVDFVRKQSYLNGFFGDVRPLQSMQITHLYDNILNNATSKALLIGYSQTAKSEQLKKYFVRGIELADAHMKSFAGFLQKENLPAPPSLDHLVTDSTVPLYSDKMMLAQKLDFYAMRIRTYGNSIAVNARRDVAVYFGKALLDIQNYAEEGLKIMIDSGWLERPPQAADREALVTQ